MKENHRKALLKLSAENPGFFNHAQNWGMSLFDGKQGTSQTHFDNMMNSRGAQDFKASWDAFTKSSGDWLKSLQDGKTGTSGDAFKAIYSGKGAPWAWGLTGLTALNMAGSFDNPITRTAGNVNQVMSAVNGILPWAIGYAVYNKVGGLINKWAPIVKSGVKAWNDTKSIREFRKGPGFIESLGSPEKLAKYIQNASNARANFTEIRNNPEKAKNLINATEQAARLTGDWGTHRDALVNFGTTDDEYIANNGLIKSMFMLRPSATLSNAKRRLGMQLQDNMRHYHVEDREEAKRLGMSDQEFDNLDASVRTGRINGSIPAFNVQVTANGNNTFDQQRDLAGQLRRSGALSAEAHARRIKDINTRESEYNKQLENYNNELADWRQQYSEYQRNIVPYAENYSMYAGSGIPELKADTYSRSTVADPNFVAEPPKFPVAPKAPSPVNIAKNKPSSWSMPSTRTFSGGEIKIKNADDLSKMHR